MYPLLTQQLSAEQNEAAEQPAGAARAVGGAVAAAPDTEAAAAADVKLTAADAPDAPAPTADRLVGYLHLPPYQALVRSLVERMALPSALSLRGQRSAAGAICGRWLRLWRPADPASAAVSRQAHAGL
jgi:hypothetical protein